MSLEQDPHELWGVADPVGKGIGFLLPLFGRDRANHPRTEVVDAEDRVVAFAETPAPDISYRSLPASPALVGDAAFYAFAFGPEDIVVGRGTAVRNALAERIGDPLFETRPMLGVEVAEFLQLPDFRLAMARRAFSALKAVSAVAAERWRDLSLLTPDLRKRLLASELTGRAHRDAAHIVATVHDEEAELRVGRSLGHRLSQDIVTREFWAAYRPLEPLYSGELRELRSVIGGSRPNTSVFKADALIWISEKRLALVAQDLAQDTSVDFETFGPDERDRFNDAYARGGTPAFVLFVSGLPGQSRVTPDQLFGDFAVDDAICLHARFSQASRHWFGKIVTGVDRPTIELPGESFGDHLKRLATTVREALLVRRAADFRRSEPGPRNEIYLRARGDGHSPCADAQALIMTKAWRRGLIPKIGVQFSLTSLEPNDWGEVLMPDLVAMGPGDLFAPWLRNGAHAALLVANEPRGPDAIAADYERVMTDAALHAGWRIVNPGEKDAVFTLAGERDYYRCRFDIRWSTRNGGWDPHTLFDTNLEQLDRLILTEELSAAATLRRLTSGEGLPIGLRDMVALSPEEASVWDILGIQLRRYVGPVPARARTYLLAMLLEKAFERGEVLIPDSARLARALDLEALETVNIICTRVRRLNGETSATIRVFGRREIGPTVQDPIDPFILKLSRNGPQIHPAP